MLRIATFGGVQPAALAELTEVLNNLLDGQNLKRSKMGGVRTAAEIINLMKTQQEEAVIDAMREYDGELAQKIIDEMFLFENLVEVDDRSIQRLLQEVEGESLLIALKGAEQPLREVPQNMSQRAADILRDDLANRGPVRMSQVENEQKAILLVVRRLAESGEMIIGGGGTPMSDRINTLPWQPWSLNDLGEQKPAVELPQLPDLELDDPSPDAQAELQQQLATLRLQAEQQGQQLGYADGQQKAMRPVFSPTGGRPPARAAGSATAAAAADRPLAAAGHRIPAHAGRARQRDRFAADAAGTDRRQTGAGPAAGVRRHCLLAQIQQLIQQEPMFNGKPQLRVRTTTRASSSSWGHPQPARLAPAGGRRAAPGRLQGQRRGRRSRRQPGDALA